MALSSALLFTGDSKAAAEQQDPVFSTTTRLVEVSTIITDAKGVYATGLTRDDFSLLEDGKPQRILQVLTEPVLRDQRRLAQLPPNVYTNRPEALPHPHRSINVLVLDYLNSTWGAQTATREQILRFLRALDGEDLVAIYSMGNTLSLLHDFTSDRKSLIERLEKSPGMLSVLGKSEGEIVAESSARWLNLMGEEHGSNERFYQSTSQRARTLLTLQSLSLIARHIAGFPGRKNLIWLSNGFPLNILTPEHTSPKVIMSTNGGNRIDNMPSPAEIAAGAGSATLFQDSMDRAIDTICAAGVVVYGMQVGSLYLLEDRNIPGYDRRLTNSSFGYVPPGFAQGTSLVTFSERTGGLGQVRSTSLEGALRSVLSDSRHYYLLTYQTSNPRFDGKFRKIEVRVNRPGLRIRHRAGYTAHDPAKDPSRDVQGDLEEAGRSPVTQSALLLTAQALSAEGNSIQFALQIDAAKVSFRSENDVWVGALDLVFYQKSPDGKMAWSKTALPLKLTAEQYSTVMRKGLLYRHTIERASSATVLRVGVRDSGSGLVGTLDIPLSKP
ncbi:VWA domain-containing protein [uncultured Paludibaculum sp.]|uniref:VWA domain-containing protein n=1 Tax=uncultured Paludibaculum sp. TaxID=1765020 RepID=UPI002AAADBAC|nr:VWA domain-containing protein [uncultured Paludibaculum sp.]